MAETSTLFMKLLCKKTKMKIIGEILASFRNTSYLCNVKCMFDYPGKFPERARLYRHYPFRRPLLAAFSFVIVNNETFTSCCLTVCCVVSYPENTEKYHCTIVPFAFWLFGVGMVYYIYIYYYIYYNIYNNIYKSIGSIFRCKFDFRFGTMVRWYEIEFADF